MKKLILILAGCVMLYASVLWATTNMGVMKNSAGVFDSAGGVTYYVTKAGVTVFEIDPTAGVSGYFNVLNIIKASIANLSVTIAGTSIISVPSTILTGTIPVERISGTTPTFSGVTSDVITSGASLISNPTSGITLSGNQLNTVIAINSASWTWLALPSISATTVQYIKIIDIGGGGVTVAKTDAEPFQGNGVSGNSVFVLPSNNHREAATFYGIADGTTTFWQVEFDGSWETRGD